MRRRQVVVALHEARRALEQAEHVVGDQHLPVAFGRCADADHRDRHRAGDLGRDLFDHAFDDQAEGAGLGDQLGIADDPLPLLVGRGRARHSRRAR